MNTVQLLTATIGRVRVMARGRGGKARGAVNLTTEKG